MPEFSAKMAWGEVVMLTHCSGIGNAKALLRSFCWRPCGSVQNSMAIEKLMGIARNWGESIDDVQGDNGPLFVGEVHADF